MKDQKRPLPCPDSTALPVAPVPGEPTNVWDQINKYGTYEVQDTTDTDNVFPCVGPEGGWRACLEPPDTPPRRPD